MILDLCSGSGAWSQPYADAGYRVIRVDLTGLSGAMIPDVRLLQVVDLPVYGILAAPPCTDLSVSGARWWERKGPRALFDALAIADACLRAVALCKPVFWALENPVGRLRRFYGDPRLIFDPCDYGDPYTKKTLLWGDFFIPAQSPVDPVEGSKMHLLPPSPGRAAARSKTPPGFARAFFEANP